MLCAPVGALLALLSFAALGISIHAFVTFGDRLNAVGGTYKVVSAPGRGTELFVSIPVAITGLGSK